MRRLRRQLLALLRAMPRLLAIGMIAMLLAVSFLPILFSEEAKATLSVKYEDDFESGNINKWESTYGTVSASTEQHHGGSYSFKATAVAGYFYARHDLGASTISYPNQVDFWYYLSVLNDGQHYSLYRALQYTGGTLSGCVLDIIRAGSTYTMRAATYSSGWTYSDICTFTTGAWHHIYVNQSSDSSYTLWFDGAKQGTTWSGTHGSDGYILKPYLCYAGDNAITSTLYIDDWKIETGATDPALATWTPSFTSSANTHYSWNSAYHYHAQLNESGTITNIGKLPTWMSVDHNGSATNFWLNGSYPDTTTTFTIYLQGYSAQGTKYSWQNFSLSMNSWKPTFTSTSKVTYKYGIFYSYHPVLNESGNITNLATLPAWMSVANNGTSNAYWNGTPTTTTTYAIKIGGNSLHGTLNEYDNYSLAADKWAPSLTSSNVLNANLGVLYSYHIIWNESVTLTAISLPSWLSLLHNNTSTTPFWLNGTPSIGGSYSIKLEALSAGGRLYSYDNFSVNIGTWAPIFTNGPLTNGTVGILWTYSPICNESATFELIIKPPWASMVGGTISGTPVSPAMDSFELQATSVIGTLSITMWFNVTVKYGYGAGIVGLCQTMILNQSLYYASLTLNVTGNLTAMEIPYWLTLLGNGTATSPWILYGVAPLEGNYTVNLRSSNPDMAYGYSNFTIQVLASGGGPTIDYSLLIVTMVFLCLITGIGLYKREVLIVTGFSWVGVSLFYFFPTYPVYLMIISMGVGLAFLFWGALEWMD